MKRNPVSRINKVTIDLETGEKFTVMHQLSDRDFATYFDRWGRSYKERTVEDLCGFVKMFFPSTMFVSEADYNRLTKGKAVHATEAEYLAENPSKQ